MLTETETAREGWLTTSAILILPQPPPAGAAPVKAVRGESIEAKQGVPYLVGVSSQMTGATGISMQLVTLPPGGACLPHIHVESESALYIVSGHVETLYGENLSKTVISGPGDFLFIPPGVPHQGRNRSATEPVIAVVARNDADEQERVVPYVLGALPANL